MKPTEHPSCNSVLRRPEGTTEEECGDLPIRRSDMNGQPLVSSFWIPENAEEKEQIQDGATIMLVCHGRTHPPIALVVVPPEKNNLSKIRQWFRNILTGREAKKELEKTREAMQPVIDWYSSDLFPPRDVSALVSDIVQDLISDRKDINELVAERAILKNKLTVAERQLRSLRELLAHR